MKPGILITVEGGEGTGKSTLVESLAAYIRKRGRDVVVVREPGQTVLGERVRALILDQTMQTAPMAELLLFEAARAQLMAEVVEPALAAGKVVLADRFTDSTVAYQGFGRGMGVELVARLNDAVTDARRPDLTLWLDLDPRIGIERARSRSIPDRLESEDIGFHGRVRAGFAHLAQEEPTRIRRLDATLPPDELARLAAAVVVEALDG